MASHQGIHVHGRGPEGEFDEYVDSVSPAVSVQASVEDEQGTPSKFSWAGMQQKISEKLELRDTDGTVKTTAGSTRETPTLTITDTIEEVNPPSPSLLQKIKQKISRYDGAEEQIPQLSYEVAATANPQNGAINPVVKQASGTDESNYRGMIGEVGANRGTVGSDEDEVGKARRDGGEIRRNQEKCMEEMVEEVKAPGLMERAKEEAEAVAQAVEAAIGLKREAK